MTNPIVIPEGVPTRIVRIGRGACGELPYVLAQLDLLSQQILVLQDAHTRIAAAQRVEAILRSAGIVAVPLVLDADSSGHVPGDETQVEQVQATVAKHRIGTIISVGSGVINDLGKLSARLSGCAYVSVATAASMNGYGSPIAAIIEKGVKRTLPAASTLAIIADLDVIASAPIDMTRSGFADLLSKATANTDWMLAHLVRDEPYDPRPHEILEPIVAACREQALAIGKADPAALESLMHGLIFGGFAMTLAGRSTPASGGEHLISHYWDMQAHARGTAHALHGYQVAIGTRMCAALYDQLMKLRKIDVENAKAAWQPWSKRRKALKTIHGELFDAIEDEAHQQQLTRKQFEGEVTHIANDWGNIRKSLKPMLQSLSQVTACLKSANVPMNIKSLGQTRAAVRHAFVHATDVRARYTVLDLARSLNVLDVWADGLLDDCHIK